MKHPDKHRLISLVLAAASVTVLAPAGEDRPVGPGPRPGLEVFDEGTPVRPPVSRYPAGTVGQPAGEQGQEGDARRLEGQRDDLLAEPVIAPHSQQPPYRAPDIRRPPHPIRRQGRSETETVSPEDDPFANLDGYDGYDDAPAGPSAGGEGEIVMPEVRQPLPPEPVLEVPAAPPPPPMVPLDNVLDNLNIANPYFPGLHEAVRSGSLPAASQTIWNTLRQRQAQGAYRHSTILAPTRLYEVLTVMPPVAEDPLLAAQRVNILIDAFQSPEVASPAFAGSMPQVLTRLHNDIYAVHQSLGSVADDGVYLELARTYVRALTNCDFFAFPRRQMASDIRRITQRASGMFYPDGSSRGGDVCGITGNVFHMMFMLDRYSIDDGWFKRDIGPISRSFEIPGRFLSGVVCPDGTFPNFGPRGTRELLPVEAKALTDVFPPLHPRMYRIGLAGTNSYPPSSKDSNYSGIYAMRDKDGRSGRYLGVRFGPVGNLIGVPGHADFGSMVLMSRGVKYLADPGGYGGDAATAEVHGGLSLDGQFVSPGSHGLPGEPSNAVWRTNASIDYVTDSAAFPDSKIWQRGIVYVKDLPGETRTDYWLVLDHVDLRDSPDPSIATIRFPIAPGVTARREGPGILMTGTGSSVNGTAMRVYAADAGVRFGVADGGRVFDVAGGAAPTQAVSIERRLTGPSTTATVFYPADDSGHRPLRIERDSDIIRGRTGVIVVDHGLDRVDVIAWAPPGVELVTPTLNLQMSADLGVFRIRGGKIARVDFVNLERFQAKEPDGGLWSMKVSGPAQTVTVEREFGGGWQVLSDPDNRGSANIEDVNFGPLVTGKRFTIKPGELRQVW